MQAILYRTLGSSPFRLPGTQIDTLESHRFGSGVWIDTWGRGASIEVGQLMTSDLMVTRPSP